MSQEQQTTAVSLKSRIDAYMNTQAEGYDLEKHYDDESPQDLFRAAIDTQLITVEDETKYLRCSSVEVKDTPVGLYRLLYLIQPSAVDFSDMYKCGLFHFRSADLRFAVEVNLFKYELGLYFYCPEDCLGGKGSFVISGRPGADNGVNCTDPDGLAFFAMVTHAVNTKWEVYSGNNFKV